MSKFLVALLLLACSRSAATEWEPWLGEPYELSARASLAYQEYAQLVSGSRLKKHPGHDLFVTLSLGGALPEWGLEIEGMGAFTRDQKGNLDHLKVTGRYLWRDDIAGDPLSVTTGISLSYAPSSSVRDVSAFHHGVGEVEGFLSFGRERSCGTTWSSRWWGLLGMGTANRGSPWWRFRCSYERRLRERHELGLFAHALWGMGRHRLRVRHFHGYGAVQHQSIDVGVCYRHLVAYFGSFDFEYAYRVHAQNFPDRTHLFLVRLLYPFGL